MVNEDIELVTVAKPSKKKSLLERYDIPIENLSYKYITQCTQVKELERIVLILRSGEEGIYPDLTKHSEERLAVIKPESTILRIAAPVLTKEMLEPENRKNLENDINEWMNEMKLREKDLKEGRETLINEPNSEPDIRQIKFNETKKKQQSSHDKRDFKRISGCDYAGWDKYDADTEINRIDIQSERKQAEVKRNQQKIREKEEKMKKSSREAIVNKRTLTETELRVLAEGEREKGNEAFKAGDYEEALQLYNSSISIDGTINGYNNRAITFLKLHCYNEAIEDCNTVISMDERNIKAFLRRGLAFEHLEKRSQALADYEEVLKLEPTNKIAIAALNKLRQPCNSKKIRMKIEEQTETNKGHYAPEESIKNRISNLKPVKSTSRILLPQVCFCNNAPSSSRHSSPRPHIREAYCSEPKKKSTDSTKSRSIFVDTKKSSVFIEEIPNESVEKSAAEHYNKGDNKEIGKKSSVVIQEIPNEAEKKSATENYNKGDNKKIGKKSSIVIEEITNESVKKSAAENYNKGDNKEIGKKSSVVIEEIPNEAEKKSATENYNKGDNKKIGKKSSIVIEEITNESVKKSVAENYNKGDNKEIGKKSSVVIEEIPNEAEKKSATENYNNGDTKKIGKKSSIVIEEITNESIKKLSAENDNKDDNKEIGKKSAAIIDESKNEKKSSDKNTKSINHSENNVNINNVDSLIVNEKNDISKMDLPKDKNDHKIKSPYEFLKVWHSIKNDPDLFQHGILLKALAPEDIDTVIGNKLDGGMLSTILRCLEKHFSTQKDVNFLYNFLQSLAKVQRFSLVTMFMDANDRKVLQKIFSVLEISQVSRDGIKDLCRDYNLS